MTLDKEDYSKHSTISVPVDVGMEGILLSGGLFSEFLFIEFDRASDRCESRSATFKSGN